MLIPIIGFAGMILVLLAFVMNQFDKWDHDSYAYDITNALGGLLLTEYSALIGSYPFLILNAIWTAVSLYELWLDIEGRPKKITHLHHKRKKR